MQIYTQNTKATLYILEPSILRRGANVGKTFHENGEESLMIWEVIYIYTYTIF